MAVLHLLCPLLWAPTFTWSVIASTLALIPLRLITQENHALIMQHHLGMWTARTSVNLSSQLSVNGEISLHQNKSSREWDLLKSLKLSRSYITMFRGFIKNSCCSNNKINSNNRLTQFNNKRALRSLLNHNNNHYRWMMSLRTPLIKLLSSNNQRKKMLRWTRPCEIFNLTTFHFFYQIH